MRNTYAIIAMIVVGLIVGGSVYGVMASVSSTVTTTITSTSVSTVTNNSNVQTTPTTTTQASTTSTSTSAQGLTAVNFIPDFKGTGYEAPWYYGVAQGIYSDNGLNVNILSASGSGFAISAVASGKADFGLADTGTLVYAIEQNNITNVRAVAMIFPISPHCIIYNKAVISNFGDLAGKTMASFQGSGENPLLPIVLQKNGINPNSVTVEYFAVTLFNQELALGKVDSTLATINQLADLGPVAASNNISLGAFMLSDYGLNMAGYALLTTTTMISQHPQEVQRFVNATIESVLASNKNPAAAVAAEVAAYPSLNATTALADFKVWYHYTTPNVNSSTFVSDPLKLGWIDPSVINATETAVAVGFNMTQVPSPSTIYTDQFVHNPA